MNLSYVDRPTSGHVVATSTTGATEVAQTELTDHAFILGLHNFTQRHVDVRVDVWSEQHDHFTQTVSLSSGYQVYCRIANVPGYVAHYQVDAQHDGSVFYELYPVL